MRYRFFKKDADGVLRYGGNAISLGDGPRELEYIQNAHQLVEGEVIYIGDVFYWLQDNAWIPLDRLVEADNALVNLLFKEMVNGELRKDKSKKAKDCEA